nr:hypothetical protein [Tanacetum cinerariifolium]
VPANVRTTQRRPIDPALVPDGSRSPAPGAPVVQPEGSVRSAAHPGRGVDEHRRTPVPACAVQDGPARAHDRPGLRHPLHRQFRLPENGADRRIR